MTGLTVIITFASVLAVIGIFAYVIFLYNGLIYLRNQTTKAWANIDVVLKKRHDLIPPLIEVVKGYAAYERITLESVTNARTRAVSQLAFGQAGAPKMALAEEQLSGAVKGLFALAEAYPNLKASEQFLELQKNLVHMENEIAERREFFNDAVNLYNNGIQRIPEVFVAGLLQFTPRVYFKADEGDRKPISIGFETGS